MPAYAELAYRVEFFGDEIERITEIDPLTGELLAEHGRDRDLPGQALRHAAGEAAPRRSTIIEAELDEQLKLFQDQGKLLEAQRLEQRTRYDLEMLREVGYCSGIENYSRAAGAAGRPARRPGRCSTTFPTTSCCSSTSRT